MWHLNRAPCQKKHDYRLIWKKKASAQITKFDSEGLRFDAAKPSCIQLGRHSLWHISKYKNDYRTQSEQQNNQHMTGLSSVPGVYVCSVKLFANCAVRWQAIYLEPCTFCGFIKSDKELTRCHPSWRYQGYITLGADTGHKTFCWQTGQWCLKDVDVQWETQRWKL